MTNLDIQYITTVFGRGARNLLTEGAINNMEGALQGVETFYYAFNNRDIEVFENLWADNDLIQLNNPLGGIMRGKAEISALYRRIFYGEARVWVEFYDIAGYQSGDMAVFVGRERGEFSRNGQVTRLDIRTTRVFVYNQTLELWQQVHHHGSIDNAEALYNYQQAVRN